MIYQRYDVALRAMMYAFGVLIFERSENISYLRKQVYHTAAAVYHIAVAIYHFLSHRLHRKKTPVGCLF